MDASIVFLVSWLIVGVIGCKNNFSVIISFGIGFIFAFFPMIIYDNISKSTPVVSPKKTYTPAQLKSMIQAGNYPAVGAETSFNVDTVSLHEDCVKEVNSVVAATQKNYPVKTISDTTNMLIVRLWTNDGIVTMTCSAESLTKSVVIAPYL